MHQQMVAQMVLTSWRKFGEMRIAHRISGARKLQMIYIYMYITLEKLRWCGNGAKIAWKLSAMRLFKTLLFPLFYVGAFVSGLRCSVLSPNPPPTHTHTPILRFHFHFHSHFRFRSLSSNTCVNKCITQSALALFSQFFSRPQCSNAPVFQCLGRGSFSS